MSQTFSKIWILVVLIIFFAGGFFAWQYFGSPKEKVGIIEKEGLTLSSLKNTEYYFLGYEKRVRLTDGQYEDSSAKIFAQIYDNKIAFGDLNDDGKEDAAVIVTVSGGGSGNFRQLAVMKNQGGEPVYVDSAQLGDRTVINSVSIDSGIITVDMISVGPGDPACCPTKHEVYNFRVYDSRLLLEEPVDWQTYRNEEQGFEFKYPTNFSLKEGKDTSWLNYQSGIIFSGPELRSDGVSISFYTQDNPELLNLYDYITKKYGGYYGKEDYLAGNEYITWVNDKGDVIDIWRQSLRQDLDGFGSEAFLQNIQNLDAVIVVYFNTDSEKEVAENDYIVFTQILSTFRFIEPTCSSVEISGYSHIFFPDIKVDLDGNGQEETVRIYKENKKECERSEPIIVKIFSGTDDCQKEVFNYQGTGNEVTKEGKVFLDLWGDGSNAVLVEDISYACGSGSGVRLRFLTHRDGEYLVVDGPQLSGWWEYKLYGEDSLGKRIIGAYGVLEEGDCGTCARKYQFEIYDWNGEKYIKTKAGLTQNKYFSESIEEIIQKEPSIINPQ